MTNAVNYNDFSSLQNLRTQASLDPKAAAQEVARQFESVFVNMMLSSMRNTIPEDSLFGSHSMESYQNMFDQQIAVDMSTKGGLGLAEIIEKQLLKASDI